MFSSSHSPEKRALMFENDPFVSIFFNQKKTDVEAFTERRKEGREEGRKGGKLSFIGRF